jgi:hypothetical protein
VFGVGIFEFPEEEFFLTGFVLIREEDSFRAEFRA